MEIIFRVVPTILKLEQSLHPQHDYAPTVLLCPLDPGTSSFAHILPDFYERSDPSWGSRITKAEFALWL